jgi:hypothetical protein
VILIVDMIDPARVAAILSGCTLLLSAFAAYEVSRNADVQKHLSDYQLHSLAVEDRQCRAGCTEWRSNKCLERGDDPLAQEQRCMDGCSAVHNHDLSLLVRW